MSVSDEFDKYFEPATVIVAKGAQVGFAVCKECGAAVLLDPRDTINRARQHHAWHVRADVPPPLGEPEEQSK